MPDVNLPLSRWIGSGPDDHSPNLAAGVSRIDTGPLFDAGWHLDQR